ncbi:LOW QUALITY PROTEIN: hypothetical protein HID58_092977 [Brassica napus]|uniref:Uncharacterized protein n=1 Tax=Brassica napus TaxID=3708 RepID=A0ABQ7XCJ9_BRANA|nr:LOW QUALITY PROTEIN: hypothetical protein HID58_092977 [Brassica napus]
MGVLREGGLRIILSVWHHASGRGVFRVGEKRIIWFLDNEKKNALRDIKGDSATGKGEGRIKNESPQDYYNMLHAVSDAQHIPQFCPCGSLTKEVVDETTHMTTSLGRDTSSAVSSSLIMNDGMHFRQHGLREKLKRECEALKEQVKMMHLRLNELESSHSKALLTTYLEPPPLLRVQ